MKRTLIALCALCALTMTIRAAETNSVATPKPKLTAEQKTARQELLDKYDTNKNGKLDKEERAKISEEDKPKLEKAGYSSKKTTTTTHAPTASSK